VIDVIDRLDLHRLCRDMLLENRHV